MLLKVVALKLSIEVLADAAAVLLGGKSRMAVLERLNVVAV